MKCKIEAINENRMCMQMSVRVRISAFFMAASVFSVYAVHAEQINAPVRIITSAEEKSSCKSLGLVTTVTKLGPNKLGRAMKKALTEVAQMGGNGMYVISSNLDWAEGASVIGEALACSP